MIRTILKEIILLYQTMISPVLGSHCRFHPTCSQYAQECLEKYSLFKALYKIIKRILRCHPFSKGGEDPS